MRLLTILQQPLQYFCPKPYRMHKRKIPVDMDCGVTLAMMAFGSKWKPCIISAINEGCHRPHELHKKITGATPRVIDMQLRELEAFGIAEKTTYGGFPLKTEYKLTAYGTSILPIIEMLDSWGMQHMDKVKAAVYALSGEGVAAQEPACLL